MYKQMTSNNTQNQKQNGIDVNQSPIMNEDEMEMFLNVRRSRSDQSMLGRLFSQQIQAQKPRPLIINIPVQVNDSNGNNNMSSFKLFRKIKKQKKKNQSDYCKNICGYITKKIIRQLCSPNYASHVKTLCNKYKCQYQEIKNFYLPKIQQVTGPSHIPSLLVADDQRQEKVKEVFKEFFQWFIKSRYLRYLLIQGKMADKKAYIKYKNYMLLAMLNQTKNNGEVVLKQQIISEPSGPQQSQQSQQQSQQSQQQQHANQSIKKQQQEQLVGNNKTKNIKKTNGNGKPSNTNINKRNKKQKQ